MSATNGLPLALTGSMLERIDRKGIRVRHSCSQEWCEEDASLDDHIGTLDLDARADVIALPPAEKQSYKTW